MSGASAEAGEQEPARGLLFSRAQLKAECQVCQAPKAKHRCGKCGGPHYCSVECQERDWPRHKKFECQDFIEHGMEANCAGAKEILASGEGSLDRQLLHACYIGRLGAVEALLQEGANPNFATTDVSCLQGASGNGHVSVVQALLAAGVHIDAFCGGEHSVTALHAAAGQGHSDVVKVLVEAGANLHIRNSIGYSPLDLARNLGHTPVANYLAAIEKRAAAAAEEAKKQAAAEANKAAAAALAAAEAAAQQAFAELMLEEGGQQTGAGGKGKGAKAKAKGGK
jgi:hypothetical protein